MSSSGFSSLSSRDSVVFELQEHLDLRAAAQMLGSTAMRALKETDAAAWKALSDTVAVARVTGGALSVRYYKDDQQEGFGRMKARVEATGVGCIPFVHMRRAPRAQLAASRYYDVDMVNCQPSILAQKLESHRIPCPLLSRYVADRKNAIDEVSCCCRVDRSAAKNLIVRLLFSGGTRGWCEDNGVPESDVPDWVQELRRELRSAAERIMDLPEMEPFKRAFTKRRPTEGHDSDGLREYHQGNTLASQLAVYLQTLECECVKALVDAVHSSSRLVGGIIYDGVLVEREDADVDGRLPPHLITRWEKAIARDTGLAIDLAVKPLDLDPEWGDGDPLADATAVATTVDNADANAWMKSGAFLTYDEMKTAWEKSTFKVVNSSNYMRISPRSGTRTVFSKRSLVDSFEHLNYADIAINDNNGKATVTMHPFIARWVRDSDIRQYMDIVLAPPPKTVPEDAYNIWSGFAVERYVPPEGKAVDTDSEAVRAYMELVSVLSGRSPEVFEYLLNWIAQIFKEPAIKRGIAILLRGEEGVGKNRFTDLLRAMMGDDAFLQTASPSNALYGRFTRLREGKMLVVINEASGSDNFAADSLIKDMITSDQFLSEGKGSNAYPVSCFARFVFTTNNDNCLKINPDSRRYVVVDASSEMKGNTQWFNHLSAHIDDAHGRYEFYRLLMDRDLRGIDWINSRPVTTAQLDMIELNMPAEHQYVMHVVSQAFHAPECIASIKLRLDDLFKGFQTWFAASFPNRQFGFSNKKFGISLTKLIWAADGNTNGFKGILKTRHGAGVVYEFKVDRMVQEMVDKRWAPPGDFCRMGATPAFVEV